MGIIASLDIEKLQKRFNLVHYAESGGGLFSCLQHMIQFPFETLWSVELDEEFANRGRWLENERVKIVQDYSVNALRQYLKDNKNQGPTLWWLDSHFIGNPDHKKTTYEESIRTHEQASFPLEEELSIITGERDISKDLFLIDDFHMYSPRYKECAWYQQGNDFKERQLVKDLGIDLNEEVILNFFKGTHDIELDFRDQIYLIATPK